MGSTLSCQYFFGNCDTITFLIDHTIQVRNETIPIPAALESRVMIMDVALMYVDAATTLLSRYLFYHNRSEFDIRHDGWRRQDSVSEARLVTRRWLVRSTSQLESQHCCLWSYNRWTSGHYVENQCRKRGQSAHARAEQILSQQKVCDFNSGWVRKLTVPQLEQTDYRVREGSES